MLLLDIRSWSKSIYLFDRDGDAMSDGDLMRLDGSDLINRNTDTPYRDLRVTVKYGRDKHL